jgi:hypothetical protein
MNKAWSLLLVLALAVPAYAQEEPVDEEAPAEAAPDGASGSESIETEPVTEATGEPVETIPVEEPSEEEPLETDALPIYAGIDFAKTTLSASSLSGFPTGEYDSGIYRLRAGARLLDQVSLELHYGFDAGDEGPGEASTNSYYGLFAVPSANLFDLFELAFPIGYAMTSVERPGASEDLGSIAYGLNAELPLRTFGQDLPDVRFGLGWMVYYQKSDARLYGANLGLRYGFTTAGFGLGGIGEWFSGLDLWPFGDDEEAAPEEPSE